MRRISEEEVLAELRRSAVAGISIEDLVAIKEAEMLEEVKASKANNDARLKLMNDCLEQKYFHINFNTTSQSFIEITSFDVNKVKGNSVNIFSGEHVGDKQCSFTFTKDRVLNPNWFLNEQRYVKVSKSTKEIFYNRVEAIRDLRDNLAIKLQKNEN